MRADTKSPLSRFSFLDRTPPAALPSPVMLVVVNGNPRELPESTTVAELLRELELEGKPTAVEVNRNVVPKKELENTALNEGDRIEVVTFVGGG